MDENLAEEYIKKVLRKVREVVDEKGLDKDRLPAWVESAEITGATSVETLLFCIRDGKGDRDSFEYREDAEYDVQLIFEDYPVEPVSARLPLASHEKGDPPSSFGVLNMQVNQSEMLTLDIEVGDSIYGFDVDYHRPLIHTNQYFTLVDGDTPIETAYTPVFAAIPKSDIAFTEFNLEQFVLALSQALNSTDNSELGDYYEQETTRKQSYLSRVEDSVLVLGAYDGGEFEHELETVRDALRSRGYRASLIKELPAHPSQSLPKKVKTWALTSRFVVVVDRDSSGHLVEYSDLKGRVKFGVNCDRRRWLQASFQLSQARHC